MDFTLCTSKAIIRWKSKMKALVVMISRDTFSNSAQRAGITYLKEIQPLILILCRHNCMAQNWVFPSLMSAPSCTYSPPQKYLVVVNFIPWMNTLYYRLE